MAMSDTHTIDANGNSLLELFRKFGGAMDRREVAEAKVLKKFNSWIDNFPDEHVVFRSNKFSRYVRDLKKGAKYCSFPIWKAATRVLEIWKQKVYRNVKIFRSRWRNQVLEIWKRNFYRRNFKVFRSRRVHPWFSFKSMKKLIQIGPEVELNFNHR